MRGVKNDRFPLTFGMPKIRTILSIRNQNKFHMDPEFECKTESIKALTETMHEYL